MFLLCSFCRKGVQGGNCGSTEGKYPPSLTLCLGKAEHKKVLSHLPSRFLPHMPRNEQIPRPPFSMSLGPGVHGPDHLLQVCVHREVREGKMLSSLCGWKWLMCPVHPESGVPHPPAGGRAVQCPLSPAHAEGCPNLFPYFSSTRRGMPKSPPLQVCLGGCDAQCRVPDTWKGNSQSLLAQVCAGDGHRESSLPG